MLDKIKSLVADIGITPAAVYSINRLFNLLTRGGMKIELYYFITQPVLNKRLIPERLRGSIDVRSVQAIDLKELEIPLTVELLENRNKKGIICLGIYENDSLMGYHCFSFGTHDDELYRARFDVGPTGEAVWDFDIFILPEYRGGLGFAILWDGVFEYLRDRKINWLTSYIAATNKASLRSHLRMGSFALGKVIFIQVWMLQIVFSTRFPRFHASFTDLRKPIFYLAPPSTG